MKEHNESGYYHVWIAGVEDQSFFQRSIDKAFFLSLMKQALSPYDRLQPASTPPLTLAVEIDLLAYSLTETGIHLLVYALRKEAIDSLGQHLLTSYAAYLNGHDEYKVLPFDTIFIFDVLAGPHEALNISREIHLLHPRWRHDRYSSIGFYLDDRRADWMRIWRLTRLYDNKPSDYLAYIKSPETETDKIFDYIHT